MATGVEEAPRFNAKLPSVKRIMQEARELELGPSEHFTAAPLEGNLFEWHFTVRGPDGTEFSGGRYHGRLLMPAEYPFKPPTIMMLTPNGRFELRKRICLSISDFHPEQWQPAWGVRTIMTALIAFLPTPADGAVGALDYTPKERARLAVLSATWRCEACGARMRDVLRAPGSGQGRDVGAPGASKAAEGDAADDAGAAPAAGEGEETDEPGAVQETAPAAAMPAITLRAAAPGAAAPGATTPAYVQNRIADTLGSDGDATRDEPGAGGRGQAERPAPSPLAHPAQEEQRATGEANAAEPFAADQRPALSTAARLSTVDWLLERASTVLIVAIVALVLKKLLGLH